MHMELLIKLTERIVWLFVGLLILPAILISTFVYPLWENWGQKL